MSCCRTGVTQSQCADQASFSVLVLTIHVNVDTPLIISIRLWNLHLLVRFVRD